MNLNKRHCGFVLLVTMIVLVVLSSLVAGLAVQLTMARRRQSYMVEYQRARYGLDSALKYFLAEMPKQSIQYADREGKPDFSDVFLMDRQEYSQFIADWAAQATDQQIEASMKEDAVFETQTLSSSEQYSLLQQIFGDNQTMLNKLLPGQSYPAELMREKVGSDEQEADEMEGGETSIDEMHLGEEYYVAELDPNDIQVPGPYGFDWPYVIEPLELEIGPTSITIDIEDENAKLPLSWFVTSSKDVDKKAKHALDSFCEWMSWTPEDLKALKDTIQQGAGDIQKKKIFKFNAGPIITKTTKTTRSTASTRRTVTSRRSPTRRTSSRVTQKTTERPAVAHRTDFAKLFHSSLLDRDFLARPLPDTGDRVESPLKYLGLWGSQRVNINTAPRHVLEATFMMVMDSFSIPDFVQEVINRRQEKPFTKLDELKELGGIDADTLKELNNYMTTKSTFFKIRVTSYSGNASASAIATVIKEGAKTETLAILYEH